MYSILCSIVYSIVYSLVYNVVYSIVYSVDYCVVFSLWCSVWQEQEGDDLVSQLLELGEASLASGPALRPTQASEV